MVIDILIISCLVVVVDIVVNEFSVAQKVDQVQARLPIIHLVVVVVDSAASIQTIHDRHIDIEYNHVKVVLRILFYDLDGLVAIFGCDDRKVLLELIDIAHQQKRFIVHQEHKVFLIVSLHMLLPNLILLLILPPDNLRTA